MLRRNRRARLSTVSWVGVYTVYGIFHISDEMNVILWRQIGMGWGWGVDFVTSSGRSRAEYARWSMICANAMSIQNKNDFCLANEYVCLDVRMFGCENKCKIRTWSRWAKFSMPMFSAPVLDYYYKVLNVSDIYIYAGRIYSVFTFSPPPNTSHHLPSQCVPIEMCVCVSESPESVRVRGCFFSASNVNFDSLQKTKITNQICTSETFGKLCQSVPGCGCLFHAH